MKKLALSLVMTVLLAVGAFAADPVISIDFANGEGDVVLENAEIVEDVTRGKVLQIYGDGNGSNGQSYGLLETTAFEDNDWSEGMSVSMWYKTDVGTMLAGTTPLFSLDIAGVGYISVVASLESAINTDGNDTSYGITPRCWNDPANISSGVNKTTEGAWEHMVAVYGQDGMKIYVNGELYSEPVINNCSMDDFLFQVENFVYGIRLGSWLCSWWNYGDYQGMIDDVAVYNVALDESEVADLFEATSITQTVFEEGPSLEDLYTDEYIAPIKSFDFEGDNADIELVNAEITAAERGNALKINGTGNGTNGTSYALWTTDFFQTTDWSKGITVDLWMKANTSDTLLAGAPLYSFDIANQGYIGVINNLQSGINTDGNEDVGISPRMWNDPSAMGDPSNINRNEWVHVTVVYDESGMKIYKNGELHLAPGVNGGAMSDLFTQMNLVYSLRFGSWLCSWWNYGEFEGLIDDFSIYNAPLNPLQVSKLHAGTYAPAAEAPVETAAPETAAPETEAPVETAAPETEAPVETAAPETEAPVETAAPETEAPVETVAPVETPVETAPATFDSAIIAVAALAISGFAAYKAKKRD